MTSKLGETAVNSIDYNPEPGGPEARVLDLLARNPAEDYSSSDLALKFQVPKAKWDVLLATAVAKGLVHRDKSPGDPNVIWCAGAQLAAWTARHGGGAVTTAAPTLPPFTRAAPNRKRGGSRPALAELDMRTVTVEIGGQIARPTGPGGASKWAPLFDLLKAANTSVAVPLAYKGTLAAYVKKRKKDGRLVGTFIVGIDAADRTKCRVLRTA